MRYSIDELNSMLNGGYDVYAHYYPEVTGRPISNEKTKMISPFLRNGALEEDPSFSIFVHHTKGTVFFKDHGIDRSGTHWQFVMDLFNIDFKSAVAKVKADILGIGERNDHVSKPIFSSYIRPVRIDTRTEIIPAFRGWEQPDLDYYKQGGISKSTLELFYCKPISSFEVKKENKTLRVICNGTNPAYCYSFPSGNVKIVQPFNDRHKWTSNLSANMDVFGFHLVPKSCDHLFIIGGNRDCMSFYENIGHPVISLASESTNISDELRTIIRMIAKNVWVLYDNDKQGYRKAERFEEDYGFQSMNHIYQTFGAKDFVDFMQKSGDVNKFTFLLEQNINNSNT
jgi:5S rRNA maturation endonuclease (ribonuclease M5)